MNPLHLVYLLQQDIPLTVIAVLALLIAYEAVRRRKGGDK